MKNFIKFFKEELVDIYQIGVANLNNDEVELIENLHVIFLQFETTYLKFEAIEQNSKLEITKVEEIDFGYIPIEEELPPYKYSISNLVFIDEDFFNILKSITIYGDISHYENKIICDSILLTLGNQLIFFDPSYHWGINIGNELQLEEWLRNQPEPNKIKIKEYNL